ncbi:MAG TPA: thioredoxin-like domain-containing protein [Verrucomicrobiae bacterium]
MQSYAGKVRAPEFPSGLDWINIDHPLTMQELRGKIVLLDFWTYGCINCIHIIPDLKRLEAEFPNELVVIGVHSAKFDNEKQTDNIRQAILRYEIEHPVINDKDFVVWHSFGARSWPTLVLINPSGRIIGYHSGEGIYDLFDHVIGETVRHFDEKKQIDRAALSLKLERTKGPKPLFSYPGKIAGDAKSKRLFFSDSNHNRLIVATLDGAILDVIGDGEIGLRDGDFATARFFRPQGVCFDGEKNFLYVADTENHAIRRVDLNAKTVETLAGTGQQARRPNVEGTGRRVELNSPWDVLLKDNTLFIAMAGPHQLWSLNLTTLEAKVHAGSGRENIADGELKSAALAQPSGLTTDGQRIYFADSEVSAVRAADFKRDGRVETLIGEGLFKFGDVDGKFPEARLQHCIGVAWHEGFVYVADTYNHKIKRLDPKTRELTSFLGSGRPGAADGDRAGAQFNEPNGLCFVGDKMYVADSNNHLIRVCEWKSGQVRTLAFTGLEKLERRKTRAFSGEEVQLKPARISPQAKLLMLEIALPAGTKLNPAGPSKLKLASADAKVVEVGAFDGSINGTRVSLPIQTKPGQTTLTFEADLYYCSKSNEGLCFFKSARLHLPVVVGEDGSASPTAEFRVEK